MLVANIDTMAIELHRNQQIASYEEFEECEGAIELNNVIELVKDGELVRVGQDLNKQQIDQLAVLLRSHLKASSINGEVGNTDIVQHRIGILPNAKPVAEPLRRRPELHIQETKRQVKDMLQKGVIEKSYSPWAAAYVIVRKKSGEFRFCVALGVSTQLHKRIRILYLMLTVA